LSSSNETRKPAGRPSLLSAEQQNALENQPATPEAFEPPAAEAPGRKHLWIAGGVSVLVVGVALAFMSFGGSEPAVETVAAAPAPAPAAPAPVAAPAAAPSADSAVAAQSAQAADNSPLAALTAPSPQVAAIIDESPPPVAAKPKESLKQMLESGTPAASKPAAAKAVRKPVKEKPSKESGGQEATPPSAEEENDIQLLAALVAHAKYDTSANARLSLPKALEQCKKQGKQDAARCRLRVCEGRWKKNECRVYSRSKLEKTATGA